MRCNINKKKLYMITAVFVILIATMVVALIIFGSKDNNDAVQEKKPPIVSEGKEKVDKLESEIEPKLEKTETKEESIKNELEVKIENTTEEKADITPEPQKNNPVSPKLDSQPQINEPAPSKPQHQHDWQPIYESVTRYRIEEVDKYYYNGKYYDDYDSGYEAYLNDGRNGIVAGNLCSVTIEEKVPYQEQVISGYKCSCGETK